MNRPVGILLTTYPSQARDGKNLGSAGYSYDFVVKQFLPVLRDCGEVVELAPREGLVEREADRLREKGLNPIHLCFMPFQHAYLSPSVPNVVVPAWEFPDVPNHEFDNEPRNNWVAMANRCAAVIVGGPWTSDVFRRGGIRSPIHVVPVPTPEWNFAISPWDRAARVEIGCRAIDGAAAVSRRLSRAGCDASDRGEAVSRETASRATGKVGRSAKRRTVLATGKALYKKIIRPVLPHRCAATLTAGLRAAVQTWRSSGREHQFSTIDNLQLSGVVYTSIFNPDDGRKNWTDLVSAFLIALRDRADATLVLKLVARNQRAADAVLGHCARLDLDHKCRLVIITDFLSRDQMRELTRASTYYITSTLAEGNCLPLMDYLAAGRPAISPCHTAISDYFGGEVGFVVESHPEPAAWPQDASLRCRTSWNRLVWSSLADQIRNSYEIASNNGAQYDALAHRARRIMRDWSHPRAVGELLRESITAIAAAAECPTKSKVSPPQLSPVLSAA